MMQFIKPNTNINFVGRRKIAYVISLVLIIITVISVVYHKGLRYGVDFAGGTEIQVKFDQKVDVDNVQAGLRAINLDDAVVQTFGADDDNEYLIRTDIESLNNIETGTISSVIEKNLEDATGANVDIRRIEMVGPQVGKDLRENALMAIFFALLLIAVYISGRFEHRWSMSALVAIVLGFGVYGAKAILPFEINIPIMILLAVIITLALFWFLKLKFAMGAVVAEIHDVVITVGILSLCDKEFTLTTVAALLTIVGYSLNDTIIVFDRIRENLRKSPGEDTGKMINRSINETLSRTILTSLTTLIVLFALFFLGGSIIHDFAFTMIVGVLIGTYSSIFVASPILLIWSKIDNKLIKGDQD